MPYPSTVDNGLVQPFVFGSDLAQAGTSPDTFTAGAVYLYPVMLLAHVTVVSMRCNFSGSPTGNCDMGIYDATAAGNAPNNLLGHTGAIVATTGLFTKNLTANLALAPGQYWIAWMDTVSDTVDSRSWAAVAEIVSMRSSATGLSVLPATIGSVIDHLALINVKGLLLNGWS